MMVQTIISALLCFGPGTADGGTLFGVMYCGGKANEAHLDDVEGALEGAGIKTSIRASFGVAAISGLKKDANRARRIAKSVADREHFVFEPLPQHPPAMHHIDSHLQGSLVGVWRVVSSKPDSSTLMAPDGQSLDPDGDLTLKLNADRSVVFGTSEPFQFRGTWDYRGIDLILYMGNTKGIWPRWVYHLRHGSQGPYLEGVTAS